MTLRELQTQFISTLGNTVVVFSSAVCLPLTLIMADYLKGLFGIQNPPPPATEDGMLGPATTHGNNSNLSQTSQTLPEPQILPLLPSRLVLRNQQLRQEPLPPAQQMSSSPNGTASGNERAPRISTPRLSFCPLSFSS